MRTLPDVEELEEFVKARLEKARRLSGLSQEEMVERLAVYQVRPARHRSTWYRWLERPKRVSALTYAAALMLGAAAAQEAEADFGDLGTRPPGEGQGEGERAGAA